MSSEQTETLTPIREFQHQGGSQARLVLHTEKGLVQICDKTAIKALFNDERSLNRGSYSLLKYSNNGDAVSLKYRSNDGSVLLLSNNN